MKDYFALAFKNLRHRGIRSWLTLLGIFIGVMAVVSLISLGAGLKMAVGAQFGISSTEVITVQAGGISAAGPPGTGVTNKLSRNDANAIERLSVIDVAIPRIITTGKMEFNNRVAFGMVSSMPNGEKRKVGYDIMDIEATTGRMLKDGDLGKVVLGWNFYKDDSVFGRAVVPGKTVLIQDEKFEVVGITKKKGSFIFDNLILMNDDDAIDLFNYGDDVDLIAVRVKDKNLMDRAKEDIEKLMRKRRDVDIGKEDFEVSTPDAMLSIVNNVLGGVQAFIVIIASFVTIVELVMQAYMPALFEQLGLFIPLIVVNCIVLGRAEAFASKETTLSSAIDGLGMGLGFAFALTLLGGVREILGSGALFNFKFMESDGMLVFVLAPGAFIVLGYLIAIINRVNKKA